MFLQILIAILLGVVFGIITGLTPGIHVNLVAAFLISSSVFFLKFASPLILACFIVSMAVTHTFLDFIPSIYLGAPETGTFLGVLPGHRYLLRGNGLMAVKLTLIGSFGALLLSIALFPFFVFVLKKTYAFLEAYIAYILILISLYIIATERKWLWASAIFILSGLLGIVVFRIPNFENSLFPLLSGLFGISTLLVSLKDKSKIPRQNISSEIKLRKGVAAKALVIGQLSGFITAVLPGIGAATAALLGMQVAKLKDHGFMILLGSVNTVNFVLSLAALLVLDKARNGAVVAIKGLADNLTALHIALLLCSALLAGCISVYLTLFIGKKFSMLVNKVNYKLLVISTLLFIFILTLALTKFTGTLILITATAIGLIPPVKKIRRVNLMGCLVVPVILYFIY